MAANRTIDLDGVGIPREGNAGAAGILPGMLVEVNASDSIDVHGLAGNEHTKTFAMENAALGGDHLTAYTNGDRLQYRSFQTGARVNAIAGGTVSHGEALESAGNGKLITATTGNMVVGICLEAGVDDGLVMIEISSGAVT